MSPVARTVFDFLSTRGPCSFAQLMHIKLNFVALVNAVNELWDLGQLDWDGRLFAVREPKEESGVSAPTQWGDEERAG